MEELTGRISAMGDLIQVLQQIHLLFLLLQLQWISIITEQDLPMLQLAVRAVLVALLIYRYGLQMLVQIKRFVMEIP